MNIKVQLWYQADMKKTLYWILTLLFPFVILGLAEVFLRIGGYNADYQKLFVEAPSQPDNLTTNPDFFSRYFPSFQPQVAVSHFQKTKEKHTFRIFVMGGSSTQGFPYNFYNSFPAKLEERLLMETQGLDIQVINLGMTAVNSYVIWDLSKRLIEYDPDAIIIYAGHNEYYGSFGVGSTQFGFGKSVGLKRLILNLKDFRLYQVFEELMKNEPTVDPENRTLMAKVVKDAEINLGGDLYEAGINQFEKNISSTLQIFSDESVPVFIGTVASNLKDQAPLGDNSEAISKYDEAARLFNVGDTTYAAKTFREAKDLDDIRFRAPSEINEVITEVASRMDAKTIDVNKIAIQNSVSSIPDSSLFVDHLHPDWEGHQIIADLFFDELVNKIDRLKASYSPNTLFKRTPVTDFEETFAAVPIERLTAGYPFKRGVSEKEELANFRNSYEAHLNKSYVDSIAASASRTRRQVSLALTDVVNDASRNNDSLSVIKYYKDLAYWQIYNDKILKRGLKYAINNRSLDAYTAKILHIALRLERDDPYYANSLAALYLIYNDLERAEEWLKKSKEVDENSLLLWYNYARFYALKGDSVNAKSAFEKYNTILNTP